MIRLLIFAVLAVAATYSTDALASEYGPYRCNACVINSDTAPHDSVLQFFHDLATQTYFPIRVGDYIAVCNADNCSVYEYKGLGNFEWRSTAPNDVSGGGGGSPTGYYFNPDSFGTTQYSCYGTCTGTVTVGTIGK